MNQGFWMAKSGCLNDNEMTYDNPSRNEPKRPHQWFMDGPEVELFPNKKQAVEVPNSNIFPGMLNSNISAWDNAPNFQSFAGHVSEQLFDSETVRATSFDDRNLSSVSTEKLTLEKEVNDDPFGNDPSFSLSMSHTLEDPRSGLTYGGFRKVKVNEVKDSENHMNLSMGCSNSRENDNTSSAAHAFNKMDPHSISMGLTYNKEDDIVIPLGGIYGRTDNNFMSMAQTVNKIDGSLSTDQGYKHSISMVPIDQTSNKRDNNIISMGQTHNRVDDSNLSSCLVYHKGQESTVSMGHAYSNSDNSMLSIGHSYNKGESTIISFGGYDDDANTSKRLISSYGLLLGQASAQQTEATNMQKFVYSNTDALLKTSHIPASGIGNLPKKKDDQKLTKKGLPNNFPSNVRSLLSTGMLDGVTVKYMAWSREELRGVIQGSGYSCGCQSCNFSKVINAFEFERHAGCKTKHPNNHIYFENGKTIYGIVQELRGTPQNILFEVIQTITGTPINQKAFRIWKESFLAATRELQRIYGNDEGTQFS